MPKDTVSSLPATALWYDGKTAMGHHVRLFYDHKNSSILVVESQSSFLDHHLASANPLAQADPLESADPLAIWPLGSIRFLTGPLDKAEKGPVRLALDPDEGQRLILHDKEAIDAVTLWSASALATRKIMTLRRWGYATLSIWLFCIALYLVTPFLFGMIALLIPREWEESLGAAARETTLSGLEFLSLSRGVSQKGSDSPDLLALMQRLERAADVQGYTFKVTVIDADFVNAFALPGGYLVVTNGLIADCESPDELAGVLAHEIAHVTERHGTSRMLRTQAWALLMQAFSGSGGTVGSMTEILLTSSFARDDEREADHLGVMRLVQADIKPDGLRIFFERLQKEDIQKENPESTSSWSTGQWGKVLSYVASHPDLGERQKNIDQSRLLALARRDSSGKEPLYTAAMTKAEWKRFRTACATGNGIP